MKNRSNIITIMIQQNKRKDKKKKERREGGIETVREKYKGCYPIRKISSLTRKQSLPLFTR